MENVESIVYSAMEAAKALKTEPAAVLEQLRTGQIPAHRDGRRWKIPKTLLQAYIEEQAIAEAKERRRLYEESKENQSDVVD